LGLLRGASIDFLPKPAANPVCRARSRGHSRLLRGFAASTAIESDLLRVKANPAPEIVSALAALGANFDLASPAEIDICLGLNIAPERLSFGNAIKRECAIDGASNAGIGLYAFDSPAELEKLARSAPGACLLPHADRQTRAPNGR
jgi:diaminopimelate decarboxylase